MNGFSKIILISLSLLITSVYASKSNTFVNVPSSNLSFLKNASYLKPLKKSKKMELIVWLNFRNKNEMDQMFNEIYDPSSPHYQQFLSYVDIEQRFAPDAEEENAVLQYFQSKGLEGKISHHSIRLSGRVRQIEKTFRIKLSYYQSQQKIFYSNNVEPSVSAEIAPYIMQISGLNDSIDFEPGVIELPDELNPNTPLKQNQSLNFVWKNFKPHAQPTATSIGGFSGTNLRKTYQLANIPMINSTSIDGSGQTIVVTDSCGLNTPAQIISEANTYNSANGLPLLNTSNFAIVNSDGSPFVSCPTTTLTGWELEIALDVQAIHTMAPKANIVLMLSQRSQDLGVDLIDTIVDIIDNNKTIAGFANANQISNSWGSIESFGFWPSELFFEVATINGLNLSFSTGDCGDATYSSSQCTSRGHTPRVSYPSSSAFVTAIGGSSLFVDNQWNYAFESVWGTFFNGGFLFGGGGGISKYFGPVIWQQPIKYFIAGGYGTVGQFNLRAVPDVSMVGDPITGLLIYHDGSFRIVGGTSLSNALFSGVVALVNQSRQLKSKNPIGFVAPYFYNNNSALIHSQSLYLISPPHQIISGATIPPIGAPKSAFNIFGVTFGWDSALSIDPELQFWNDAVGVGTLNVVKFVPRMTAM